MTSAPATIRVSKDRSDFVFVAHDGGEFTLSAEMLRVMSPSAEVQGHSPEQRKTVAGKKNVKIDGVKPVGNYAVRIVFSDGHDSGLFTWIYLRELDAEREERWSSYLAEIQQCGLSR
ncbi:MAG: DUF971 domain-containing protein [Pseudomonadota bacterium]